MPIAVNKLGTHFKEIEGAPDCYNVFTLGECETCGGPCQEANSITVKAPKDVLLLNGLIEYTEELPPEIFYNEETDMCDCENCC